VVPKPRPEIRGAPGEQFLSPPRVLLIAQDKQAAKTSLDYIEGALDSTPMLRQLMKDRKREEITLTNGVVIEVRAPTLRGVRGTTRIACICDEIAFGEATSRRIPIRKS
jgi:hypothetical protein